MTHTLATLLLALCCLAGLVLVPLGLPGLWVMVAGVVGYGWLTDFRSVGVTTIALVLGLALVGEIVETWLGFQTLYAKDRREWRGWLSKHHRTAPEIWLIYYKKQSGKPRIPYNHAVDEALCYGWIDSLLKPIDADRYAQRFSPRRPTSRLSAMNRERVRRLIASGRMTRFGLESIKHAFDHSRDAKPRPKWEIPKDLLRRLKGDRTVWRNFQRFPASYQRIRIGWIVAARRRRDVFEQRLRYFLKMTAQDKRFGMVQ